jgi:putative protease
MVKTQLKKNKVKKNKIELLAPAGSFPSLIAAVNAGADAVYFGLDNFNMRATAKNFSIKDLDKIAEICKPLGVKKYLTLNVIIYDKELKQIKNIIKKVQSKVDAVICWDPAIMKLCKKYKIEFHISTQASIANKEAALFYKKLGAKRIVLARELNLSQIKEIAKIIDVEVFAHGAMCVSVSGRCFTSQFLFGKSANRGECLQPCRRSYTVKDEDGNELKLENNMVMSAKDLCALPFVEDLKKAGIRAIKIEGRNREPEYVYTVVKEYRKALDKKLNPKEIQDGLKELEKVYNKGFSSGFLIRNPTNDDFSKSEHSSSTQRKEFIGKINKYLTNKQVAIVKLSSGKIKVGDELYVIGQATGFLKIKVERMEINHKLTLEVEKGDEVGIKIPGARKNDKIYLVIKK